MARRQQLIPTYRKHSSGQGRVTLVDSVTGRRKDVLLGKYGSKDSIAEYGRMIERWQAAGRRLPEEISDDLTINELILAFMGHVYQHYRDATGKPTHEMTFGFPLSLKPLRRLYGGERVADFSPLKLRAVRQQFIDVGLTRRVVNQRVWRVKKCFKWGTEHELVPPSVFHGLQAVAGLQRGRTSAPDPEPVRPVAEIHVNQTLPHMPPPVAAVVRLQLLSGARPGELLVMRTCDLNMSGRVWVYVPTQHKNTHRGHAREIYFGPKAQDVLRPWLKTELEAFIFSPAEAEQARNAERARQRKTPRYPSHLKRNDRKRRGASRRRSPKDRYTTLAYGRAIARAADTAYPPPEPLARRLNETHKQWTARLTPEERVSLALWRAGHRWHAHQLRHTAATLIRREHGIELARIILGHATAFTTEIYAETDRQQALDVIAMIG